MTDALDQRRGKGQRNQRTQGRAQQAQTERALPHAHRMLDVGQARKDVSEGEGVGCKRRVNPMLRGEPEAELHENLRESVEVPYSSRRDETMALPALEHDLGVVLQHV